MHHDSAIGTFKEARSAAAPGVAPLAMEVSHGLVNLILTLLPQLLILIRF